MSKLFIKSLGEGCRKFYTICYDADYGKTRAYKENWDPVHFNTEEEAQTKLDAIESERARADEARPFSMEEAELFVSKLEWIFAETCEKTDPHEYIVKARLREPAQKKFERFVATAKLNLVSEAHRGRLNKIFILGDHYYWYSEPYENKAAHIICRADINFIELKGGLYQYNIQRVNEAIKKREEWKRRLNEEINNRHKQSSIAMKKTDDDKSCDDLFDAAVDAVIESGMTGVSVIQRRLQIGYPKAACLVDMMEQKGYIGPFNAIKGREVLISKDRWEEIKKHRAGNT